MKTTQHTAYQLREAQRLSNCPSPNARRLGFIVYDNLVELLIRWRCELELTHDRTTWFGVRAHSRSARKGIDRYHARLLTFARDHSWIDDEELAILLFCHQLRNVAYHEGDIEKNDCELGTCLLQDFLRRYLPQHKTGKGMTCYTSSEHVRLEQIENDAGGDAILLLDDEPLETDSRLVLPRTNWPLLVNTLLPESNLARCAALIEDKIACHFETLVKTLKEIPADHEVANLHRVAEWRFFQASPAASLWNEDHDFSKTGTLNFYLAVLPFEEDLLDIADPIERTRRFGERLQSHRFERGTFRVARLEECCRHVLNALKDGLGPGIRAYVETMNELEQIEAAITELSWDVFAYQEHMYDLARGK